MHLKPGLYIISTPIGNLNDITLRALEILRESYIIFCEDTRVSSKLLVKYGLTKRLKIYNDYSNQIQRFYIQDLVKSGKVISLISDAGSPLISDPGYKLVQDFRKNKIHFDIIPGPCSVITALSFSGLPTDRFAFAGFLPKTKDKKIQVFKEFIDLDLTLIFYETSKRLLVSLQLAKDVFGNRYANVSRELTKLHQESIHSTLSELINHYTLIPAKGEIVICISGKSQEVITLETLKYELKQLLLTGISAKSATNLIFLKYKRQYPRDDIYKLTNSLK